MAAVSPSLSPSMDIQVASNFERLLFELKGRNGAAVTQAIAAFRRDGALPRRRPGLARRAASLFAGHRVDDAGDPGRRSARPTRAPACWSIRTPRSASPPPAPSSPRRRRRRADGGAGDRASGEVPRRGRARDRHPPAACRRRSPTIMEKRERVTVLPNDIAAVAPLCPRAGRGAPGEGRMTAELATLSNGLRIVTDRIDTVDYGVARPLGRCRHAARAGRGQRRRAFSRAHGVQGHRAAQRPRHRRGDRGGRRPPQRLHLARKHRLLRQGAEGGCRRSRSISSPTSCSTPPSSPEELERERTVILQEIGQANDTPDDIIFDHFQERAFPDQAMGRPVLGSPEIIQKLSRKCGRRLSARPLRRLADGAVGGGQSRPRPACRACRQAACRRCRPSARSSTEPARYVGGEHRQGRDLEQLHLVLGFPGVHARRPRLLRRLGAVDRVRRRHVLAPVPGGAREARPGLCDPLLCPRLSRRRPVRHLCRHRRGRGGRAGAGAVRGDAASSTTGSRRSSWPAPRRR